MTGWIEPAEFIRRPFLGDHPSDHFTATARVPAGARLPRAFCLHPGVARDGSANRCSGPLGGCHGALRHTYRIVYRVDHGS